MREGKSPVPDVETVADTQSAVDGTRRRAPPRAGSASVGFGPPSEALLATSGLVRLPTGTPEWPDAVSRVRATRLELDEMYGLRSA